jgi:hypothetical protein
VTPRRRRIKFWRWARRHETIIPYEILSYRKLCPIPKDFYRSELWLLTCSNEGKVRKKEYDAMEDLRQAFRNAPHSDLFEAGKEGES